MATIDGGGNPDHLSSDYCTYLQVVPDLIKGVKYLLVNHII